MKQIIQDLKGGHTLVEEVPDPVVSSGFLLINTSCSLISKGTEKMLVDFGKASLLEKALQRPDKVSQVISKIKTDGVSATLNTVKAKLNQPLPLGYSNVGKIASIGNLVSGFAIGDRVVSNGKHAEVVKVPCNMCSIIPDDVSNEEASFTVVGSIALQGIRLAQPTLGETFVVMGLGLIGLITVQILIANGCQVIGVDFDQEKLDLASGFGAKVINLNEENNLLEEIKNYTKGIGADSVIITASSTSDDLIHQAANMCRKRGRIVLVGVTGLKLKREDFYEKELSFQVSSSYGPGRYDTNYEDKGLDYPVGLVRWTAKRNFDAFLQLLANKKVNIKPLISHNFNIENGKDAYQILKDNISSLGIILNYPNSGLKKTKLINLKPTINRNVESHKTNVSLSLIGSGNYANTFLLPAIKKTNAKLKIISSNNGLSSFLSGKNFGFEKATADYDEILDDENTNTVIISTRHNTHSDLALRALKRGKNVFVEKPLSLKISDLNLIEDFYYNKPDESKPILMIGFNRRFSPQVKKIKSLLHGENNSKSFIMTVNAGYIPQDHWTQDKEIGGGRIVGEVCHFIDLISFLANSKIKNFSCSTMIDNCNDTVTINLEYVDGSIGSIHYFCNGSKSYPKENLEIFTSGRILKLDNFRNLSGYGWKNFRKMNLWRQNKGQSECIKSFIESIKNGSGFTIPLEDMLEVSRISIKLAQK